MSPLLQSGLNVTAIGMGVVFTLLTSLVFIIRGMSALARMFEGPMQTGSGPGVSGATGTPPPNELVSAISAAVATHRKRHQNTSKGN
jgi:sodium pump decarboxylase gamma subunit